MGILDDLDLLTGSQSMRSSVLVPNASRGIINNKVAKTIGGYETWSLLDLQSEAQKYGFRATNDRKVLIGQLRQIQEALERKKEAEDADISMISSSSSFLVPSSPGRSSDVEEVSMSDLTMEIIRQAKDGNGNQGVSEQERCSIESRSEVDQDEGDLRRDEDSESSHSDMALADLAAANEVTSLNDVEPSTSDQLYKAITSNKQLYHRILLFEPISFDEISSTAKRAGVTGLRSKETLRNWLDMQGICFYSADLTGSRQRY